MILGLQHPGSGCGDQLFCYLAARITAQRLGVTYAMVGEPKWRTFIEADFLRANVPFHVEMPSGKIIVENDWPIYEGKTYYDPEFNFIEDNTIVDGCRIQDERYWEEYNIAEWLKTEPLYVPDDLCVINFRGGEFAAIPELFLPQKYWNTAIEKMRAKGFTRFEVHTDDKLLASKFFPEFPIVHKVDLNWRSVRYANGAIIANSAFGIIPRLLAHNDDYYAGDEDILTIAPRRWSRPYDKDWSFAPQNYYKNFLYI